MAEWQQTACILCSINCGIEVQTDGRSITKVRGDKAHPGSKGYACEKPHQLDHYQNGRDRIQSPLRRRPDGTFEEVDWDTAISEIAARFVAIRDEHGGDKVLYYGGGGQGNHLCGGYGRATRAAIGSTFASNALAQEKTGEFWVDGQLFGRVNCHTTGDYERAEVAVFLGKNPWHSHGFPRARVVLKEIAKDPNRSLIVIDPRRTETAEMADYHLRVRPGTDAFCLSALMAIMLEEDLFDDDFIRDHTQGFEQVRELLSTVSIAEYAARCDVPEDLLREVARRMAAASSMSIFEDLGIQQAPHSTLNSYLEKVMYILTGNFAKKGGMNIHSRFAALGGGRTPGVEPVSPVGGHRIIAGLIPCNAIPDEILTDHPNRFRAALVESANPAHSVADSQRMREAFDALEFMVVIDVAMTETARLADYVLPASSQFEKWEATFFNLEFPHNDVHLRAPIFEPLPGTLPEAEIHSRLVRAMGALSDGDLTDLKAAAKESRAAYANAFFTALSERPQWKPLAPILLYETLGPTLPGTAKQAAAVWGLAHTCAMAFPESLRRAGFEGEGLELGEALFDALLEKHSGVTFTVDEYDETWRRVLTPDGKVNLVINELVDEFNGLADEVTKEADLEFPFVLCAGERRSFTANTIYRDPSWRKKDADGALRLCPEDAARLGLADGGLATITTRRASVQTTVEINDTLRPGHATLPNGLGLSYPSDGGEESTRGVAPNELTASEDRDWFAGTPWHKYVPARIEAVL